jgi:hypothetical protein
MGTATATNIATSESIKAYVDAQVGANNELSEVLANGNTTGGTDISVTSGDDITFADDSKAIFGAGSDLQIFHLSANNASYIQEQNASASLNIDGTDVYIRSYPEGDNMIIAERDSAVTLHYDNAAKLATTSTGIDVTGSGVFSNSTDVAQSFVEFGRTPFSTHGSFLVSGTGTGHLTSNTDASGNSTVGVGATRVALGNGELDFYKSGNTAAGSPRTFSRTMGIASNGDITFYDTNGNASFVYDESVGSTFNEQGENKDFRIESDGKTHMLFVDAGTNRVGINESAPSYTLDVGEATAGNLVAARLHNKDTTSGSGVSLLFSNSAFGGSNDGEIRYTNNGTNNNNNLSFHGEIAGVNGLVQLGAFEGGGGQWVTQRGAVFNESGINSDFRVESDTNTHMLFVDAGADYINIGSSVRQDNALLQVTGAKSYSGSYVVRNQIIASDTTALSAGVTGGGIGFNGVYNTGGSTTQFGSVEGLKYNGNSGDYGGEVLIRSRRNGGNNEKRASFSAAEAVFNEDSHNTDFRVESDGNANMLFVDAGQNNVGIGKAPGSGQGTLQTVGSTAATNYYRPAGRYHIFGESSGNGNDEWIYLGGSYTDTDKSVGYVMQDYNGNFGNYAGSYIRTNQAKVRIGHLVGGANSGTAPSLADNFIFDTAGGAVFNERGENGDFRVESVSNDHMLLVDAGNNRVGIGTSSPQVTADVERNSSTGFSNTQDQRSQMALTIRNGSEASGRYVGMNLIAGGGAQSDWSINNVWQSNYVGKLAFKTRTGANSTDWRQLFAMTAGIEAVFNEDSTDIDFRVESNGLTHALFLDAGNDSISIGTSTSTTDTFLRIAGSGSKYSVKYNNAYGGGTAIYANNTNNQGWIYARFNTNTSQVGYISVGTSSTAYVTSSDYRLKENVVYDWDATTRLKQLKPARFNFIVDADTTVDGFLAHEVQSVVPEAAHGTKDAVDADGNPEYQGIDQSKLVPLLVKTIQELEARITALENA